MKPPIKNHIAVNRKTTKTIYLKCAEQYSLISYIIFLFSPLILYQFEIKKKRRRGICAGRNLKIQTIKDNLIVEIAAGLW